MQIGEMLVRAKAISPADLEDAIGWQVVYGGRLGTNLLELGLVDEKVLAEALGRQHGCEWACGHLEISESMVQAIPAVVARRQEIVPWRVDGRRLKVLTVAPDENLQMFDELGFRLGKQVKPVIAPEYRIFQLLRRYFGSVRQMRALDFGVKPKSKRVQEAERKAETEEQDKAVDLMSDETFATLYQEVIEGRTIPPRMFSMPAALSQPESSWPPPPTLPPTFTPARTPIATPIATPAAIPAWTVPPAPRPSIIPAPAAPPEPSPPAQVEDEEPLLEAELLEEVDERAAGDTISPEQWASAFQDLTKELASESEPAAPVESSPLTFREAVALIGQAANRDAVAHTVLRYARSQNARAVLLSVQGDVALGWDAMGEELSSDVARRIAFPLGVPSAFHLVRESRSHYVGPLGKEAGNVRFLKLAGKKWPASAVLLPVLFRGKVVYILYADNGHKQHVNADVGELLILSQHISRSMEQMVAQRQARPR